MSHALFNWRAWFSLIETCRQQARRLSAVLQLLLQTDGLYRHTGDAYGHTGGV